MTAIRIGILLCVLGCYTAGATRWQTSSPGYWQQRSTWVDEVVPPYNSSDTFMITHPVIFDQSLVFNSGAYIRIEAGGGLCGHQNVTMHAGASMLKYGLLELDTMYIPGGHVLCKLPKGVIFSRFATVSNGGSLVIDSCGLAVGPWFQCSLPEYYFQAPAAVRPTNGAAAICLSPDPNNGSFVLTGRLTPGVMMLLLTDMAGRCVHIDVPVVNSGTSQVINTSLPAGIYYWQLMHGGERVGGGRVVLTSQ